MSDAPAHPKPLPPGGFEMIELPNTLAAKAGGFRAARIDQAAVALSTAKLIRNYPESVKEQRAALRDAWTRARAGKATAETDHAFAEAAAAFQEEAGSFGYPLVGQIGETLSLLARMGALGNPQAAGVIEAHVAAIERILDARIEGDGGSIGAAIIDSLRTAAEKAAAKTDS